MSLLKSKDYQPELDVNSGIFRIDQVQLDERSGAPTDSDLVDGRFYHLAGTGLQSREGGAWVTLGSGGGSTTLAALTDTTIAGLASAHILIYDGSDSWDNKAVSGDITIDNTGLVAIASGVIVDDDIKSNAAIAFSKLASSTDINTGGEVTDLTISGETNGDVLSFDGTNWIRLAATSLPAGTASVLAQSTTIEAGANDVTLSTTTQTVGTTALTIPDFASVSDTFVFNTLAAVLLNKTLDDATTKFGDTADATKDLFFSLGGATTGKTMTILSSHTDDRTLTLPDATDTLVGKATTDTLTNKILSDDTCGFGDSGDVTKFLEFELSGATSGNTMTILSSHTGARTLTLPDATDTLVGKATTDVFTNKSFDVDGSGNVLTNVNADELDSADFSGVAYGIPFLVHADVSNSTTTVIYSGNFPFKARLVDAWTVNTGGTDGTWKLDDGTNDITSAVNYNPDTEITRAASIDDTKHTLAANATLRCINSSATDDAILYALFIRID